jgi:hypothetical protein
VNKDAVDAAFILFVTITVVISCTFHHVACSVINCAKAFVGTLSVSFLSNTHFREWVISCMSII